MRVNLLENAIENDWFLTRTAQKELEIYYMLVSTCNPTKFAAYMDRVEMTNYSITYQTVFIGCSLQQAFKADKCCLSFRKLPYKEKGTVLIKIASSELPKRNIGKGPIQ